MRSPLRCKRRRIVPLLLFLPLAVFLLMFTLSRREESPDALIALAHDDFEDVIKPYNDKKGIQVVIGHYVGNGLLSDSPRQVSKEEMNRNGYSPVPGAGEMGEPVQLSPLEASKMRRYYDVNKFNLLVSDRISLNRTLPDVRRKECRTKQYAVDRLPSTSVIIVFHNEAWSTLLRTVHSVIIRSPKQLLKEIILVDDASDRTFLKDELDDYVSRLPVHVAVLHIEERVGLIRARLQGAAIASGEVLTFLDAHCECTTGWLTPLLARIAKDRRKVVCPIIDIINDDTFAYVKSFEMHWGAINWELHFRWFTIGDETIKLRQRDLTSPFKTPVMAGGLFAISKSYFEEIGTYDEQMDIWGGENIEISFRIWQCGGSVEIVPCSHVGHIFRRASPYSFPRPGGISAVLFSNLARVAEVWMDGWKEFFFRLHPEAQRIRSTLNVTARVELKKRLKCRSFQWYLDTVWPEHFFPTNGSFFGKLRNLQSGECLRRPKAQNGANQATGNAITSSCSHSIVSPLMFVVNPAGYIMSDEFVCLDVPDPDMPEPSVFFLACGHLKRQRWRYDNNRLTLVHESSGLCVDLLSGGNTARSLILRRCTGDASQKWKFEPFNWR